MAKAAPAAVELLDSFQPPETGDGGEFRWTAGTFRVRIPEGAVGGMLVVDALCYFEQGEQVLRVEGADGRELASFAMAQWRRPYPVRLPAGRPLELVFRLNKTIPSHLKSGDRRELGVRVYGLRVTNTEDAWFATPPVGMCLESTSRCNLNCLTCPTRADRGFRLDGLTELPVDWALEIVRTSPECRTFALHGTGEPLLSNTFREILRRAPADPPRLAFSTNLTLLDGEILDLILSGPVKEIIVSLDAASPQTYRLIRGHDLAKTLANVRSLVQARNSSGRRLPRLLAHMVLLRMNLGELPDFVRLAADLGLDGVAFWQANEGCAFDWVVERDGFRFDYREQSLCNAPEESRRILAGAIRLARNLGLEVLLDVALRTPCFPEDSAPAGRLTRPQDCPYPWKEAIILSDGTVRFCPLQAGGLMLGRLGPGVGINDIWNSPEARRCRAALAAGKLPEICRGSGCQYATPEGAGPG